MKAITFKSYSTSFRKQLYFIVLALLVCNFNYAQEYNYLENDVFTPSEINTALSTGNLLPTVQDQEIGATGITSIAPVSYVKLIVNSDIPSFWYNYTLALEITPILIDGTDGAPFTLDGANALNIEYSPNGNIGNLKNVVQYNSVETYGYKVRVVSMTTENLDDNSAPVNTTNAPVNVSLEIGFKAERYRQLASDTPAFSVQSINSYLDDNNVTTPCNCIGLEWGAINGAVTYDLEWTWIDNYGDIENNPVLDANAIRLSEKDFELNNTKITTKNLRYQIPLVYRRGYLIYRIRAVGRFLDNVTKSYYGDWSSGNTSKTFVSDWTNHFTLISEHQNNKNWQFQASYAEDGKKKEVVSYFDGTLRNRQTVTKINSDNNAIVGEVIYDNQGRPAIEVLPVPSGDNKLNFNPDFNLNMDNEQYSHLDFDWDGSFEACESIASGMATSIGASKYYGNTSTASNTFQDYVPNAKNFPFSQIEYTPDNTGRIRRKSGVGPDHQLGSGHEMKYYYATPAQSELTRLFGTNVGNVQHYKKNMVVDPNNQVSVSYIDPQGRTIATALTGATPPNLVSITNSVDEASTIDILNKQNNGDTDTSLDNNIKYATSVFGSTQDGLKVSTQIGVNSDASEYSFLYDITEATAFNPQNCTQSYPFVYDLNISLKNDCAVELLGPEDPNNSGTFLGINSITESANMPPVFLNTGTYTLSKKLTINEDILIGYADDYILSLQTPGPCFIDPALFEPIVSIDPCNPIDCTNSDCLTAFGTKSQYVINELTLFYGNNTFSSTGNENIITVSYSQLETDNNGTDLIIQEEVNALIVTYSTEWELLVEACKAPCLSFSELSTCSVSSALLLNDLSPEGQYGDITLDGNGIIQNALSIFNENNQLANGGTINSWKTPDPANPYKDYYGQESRIEIVINDDGSFTPEIDFIPENNQINGLNSFLVNPENLLYVKDFLDAWEESWTESLLLYHPEYIYLEYARAKCHLTANVGTFQDMDSDAYDSYIESIKTFADAQSAGLFGDKDDIYELDPYFSASLGLPFETTTQFNNRNGVMLEAIDIEYEDTQLDMLQIAYKTVMCNGLTTNCGNLTSFNNITGLNIIQRDKIWNVYKNLYKSLKQKIQSVHINVYAYSEGAYNGCIGPYQSPTITSAIRHFSQAGALNSFLNNVTATQFCDNAVNTYAQKQKRFVPIDFNYDSSTDEENAIGALADQTNMQVYSQSGLCPLAVDLEQFLNAFVTETDNTGTNTLDISNINRPYTAQYLSADLYQAFGGILNESQDLSIITGNGSSTLTFSIGGIVSPCSNPLTVNIPSDLSWANYNPASTAGWSIKSLSNLYYDETLSNFSDTSNPIFGFQILAQIVDGTVIRDVVFTGTTCVAIGECAIAGSINSSGEIVTNDNTIGEVLEDVYSCYSNQGEFCQIDSEISNIETSIKNILNNILSQSNGSEFTFTSSNLDNFKSDYNSFSEYFSGPYEATFNHSSSISTTDLMVEFKGDCFFNNSTFTFNIGEPVNTPGTNPNPSLDLIDFDTVSAIQSLDLIQIWHPGNYEMEFEMVYIPNGSSTPQTSNLLFIIIKSNDCNSAGTQGLCNFFNNNIINYSSNYQFSDQYMDTCQCIPQTVAPVSADEKYATFINATVLNNIDNLNLADQYTLEHFRMFNLGYLVESYIKYIGDLDITTTYDINYLSLEEFGATDLNYGYNNINTAINSYVQYNNTNNSTDGSSNDDIYWQEYINSIFMDGLTDCPPAPMAPSGGITIDTPNPCDELITNIRGTYGAEAYANYLNELREKFIRDYTKKGIEDAVETLTATYDDKEYQYTLYYYDQAGNLVQTVAPEGIDRVNQNHSFKTQYRYNTLNQLVWQKTPDGDETRFAYDKLGRIIASQNAKQIEESSPTNTIISYTLYDGLGRIIEAAQGHLNNDYIITDSGKLDLSSGNGIIDDSANFNFSLKEQITKTTYTTSSIPAGIQFTQNNTRNRVTSVVYLEDSTSGIDCNNAIFYDYDIHGNVSKIGYYIFLGDDEEKKIKTTAYKYDLISGNVNQVTYQGGETDQFIHRYEYDADNRIVLVKTSRDGILWETDASYNYYQHGPLARTVLGEQKVQGLDYAYTLQGWLKSVNGEQAGISDIGNDNGISTAKDAFGYSLNYYSGDYLSVGGSTPFTAAESGNNINTKNLYNGNIKTMVTSLIDLNENPLSVLQNNYSYDQLNRIKAMESYDLTSNTMAYQSDYDYDRNGNLKSLNRWSGGQKMDEFNYVYNSNVTNPQLKNNRLYAVSDNQALDTNFVDIDIDSGQATGTLNQTTGEFDGANYEYDAIGQLIKDEQEGITNINWRVDGKVASITKADNTSISFEYDGLGNRIAKTTVPQGNSSNATNTYYIRDAQGNVMAVYKKGLIENIAGSSIDYYVPEGTVHTGEETIQASNTVVLTDYTATSTANVIVKAGQSITINPESTIQAGTNASTHLFIDPNITIDPETEVVGLKLTEHHIYGSSRLGIQQYSDAFTLPENQYVNTVGDKRYELSNHLGNVLTVISDRKLVKSGNFSPDVLSYNDYYPFGMLLPGRHGSSNDYRYGFNGKEKDDELKDEGNSYDFGARMYDPRVGRWFATDNYEAKYPNLSPYNSFSNNPLYFIDPDGNDILPWKYRYNYFFFKSKDYYNSFLSKHNSGLMFDKAYSKMIKSSDIFAKVISKLENSSRTYKFQSQYNKGSVNARGYFSPDRKGTKEDPFTITFVVTEKETHSKNVATIFEESFHAAQNDRRLECNLPKQSGIDIEVEAKIAKAIEGFDKDKVFYYEGFDDFLETFNKGEKLTDKQLDDFNYYVYSEFVPEISRTYIAAGKSSDSYGVDKFTGSLPLIEELYGDNILSKIEDSFPEINIDSQN